MGAANWMVINGMEADKYLCEQACQGHGGDGGSLRAGAGEKATGQTPFLHRDS